MKLFEFVKKNKGMLYYPLTLSMKHTEQGSSLRILRNEDELADCLKSKDFANSEVTHHLLIDGCTSIDATMLTKKETKYSKKK